MTNNQTSIRLTKKQSVMVSYIVKENGQYEIGTESNYALFGQTSVARYNTLSEVRQAIQNIIPFLTTQENNDFKRKQKIRSLKADYSIAKNMNDTEWVKECEKELRILGINVWQ